MIFDLQKASWIKRISAFLFDLIIFCVIAVGCAVLISTIVGYDAKMDELEASYLRYEEQYGIRLDITEEEYNELSEAERAKYQEATLAFAADREVNRIHSVIFSLTLVIFSIAVLMSYAMLEIAVPFIFKNGQTLGKKIFSIAVMRTDGVKISFFQLFVRGILGKYTVETMVPLLLLMMFLMGATGFVGLLVILLIFILQFCLVCFTSTNSAIHDLFAVTVVVDMNTQMIFENTEKMIEYKAKKAQESAELKPY